MFNFLDTFEERSLKLKVLDHEAKEEKEKLEKSLEEVRTVSKESAKITYQPLFLAMIAYCIKNDLTSLVNLCTALS